MNRLLQDLRFALRAFARNPGFTLAAVLSLAIGIGANSSIFSVADALLLHALPYKDAGRLAILWNRSPGLDIAEDWFSTAQYFDIKNGHKGIEEVAIASGANDTLTGTGEPERVGAIHASSNLLAMLGAQPALGRLFLPEEDTPGHGQTAVLTDGMWVRRFGRDPQILGKSVIINGISYQIVGVLKPFTLPHEVLPTLYGPEQADIFLPFTLAADAATIRTHEDYNILARLRRGVSVQHAQAEMDTITARLRRDFPDAYPPNGGLTFSIVPLQQQVVGDMRRTLLILLGAVGFVLLIACANVANLLLARAVARQQEIAVRTALGAGRARILRQLLTESVLLALCGGVLGVVLCFLSVQGIHVLGAGNIPRAQDIRVNAEVLLFTFLLSLLSGILFGLAPALRVSRLDIHTVLKDASRGSAGASAVWGRGNNVRRLLVVSELALSVVLLIGAGLLIRSFVRLQDVAPGFNPHGVLTFDMALSGHRYDDQQFRLTTYKRFWDAIDRLPGVTASGGTTSLPLSQAFAWTPVTVEGRVPLPGEKFINADARIAGNHYFQAMEIPLRSGRLFDEHDTQTSPTAVLVDEYMAQQLWPGNDPVGKRIQTPQIPTKDPWRIVVGVVGRVKHESLDSEPRIAFYLAQTQFPVRAVTVTLRTTGDPGALVTSVKAQLHNIDPDLPMYSVRTMDQRVAESLARRRFAMLLLAVFASVALVLATIGIYGVMSYLVNQGTREIGIRIALGATPRDILSLVVRQGMALAITGVAIGLTGAFALTRFLRSLLYGVQVTDPLTFTAISVLLAAIALIASYIPAHRASRVDPAVSLRWD